MDRIFANKEIFITGGSGGIGQAIVKAFQFCGATVTAPSHRELDLANPELIKNYISQNNDYEPDVMVFCAGVNYTSKIENILFEKMEETFQVNVFSSIQLLNYYIEKMKKRGEGKIVFISSLYAFVSKEGRLSYCASKNAINGLVKTLALEMAKYNICVDAVAPGYVMTEMTERNLDKSEIECIKELIPMQRLQLPEEVADLVVFLASSYNKSITGQIIPVDGGFLCR